MEVWREPLQAIREYVVASVVEVSNAEVISCWLVVSRVLRVMIVRYQWLGWSQRGLNILLCHGGGSLLLVQEDVRREKEMLCACFAFKHSLLWLIRVQDVDAILRLELGVTKHWFGLGYNGLDALGCFVELWSFDRGCAESAFSCVAHTRNWWKLVTLGFEVVRGQLQEFARGRSRIKLSFVVTLLFWQVRIRVGPFSATVFDFLSHVSYRFFGWLNFG